ncbi:MAG: hypothetical protein NTW87_27280 [Planctomycetota bacterium]|nr:hypothetical protein [Planctomycetota bacterium]
MELNWQNGIAIAIAGLAALWLVRALAVPFIAALRAGRTNGCPPCCACRGRESRQPAPGLKEPRS